MNQPPDNGGWTPPPPGHPQPEQPQQPWPAQPAPTPRRRVGLIASVVAVIVLAGGGAVTYAAFSSGSNGGSSSPKQAVQKVIGDLESSDLVGFVDDLAPGERDAISAPMRDELDKLKQLHAVRSDLDPTSLSAVSFRTHGLTYAAKTIAINDHVQIVSLTGGTIDVRGDAAKLFTDRYLKASGQSSAQTNQSEHIDLGKIVRTNGVPIRLATVQVGGGWYPSLFYTEADQAFDHATPHASDAVPATGASSGEQAVRQAVDDLLKGDLRAAIGLISPSELGAVHDYGGIILRQAGSSLTPSDVTIKTLELTSTSISGGAERIGLKRLELVRPDGHTLSVSVAGSCVDVTADGHTQHLCPAQLAKFIDMFGAFACHGIGTYSSNGPNGCASKPLSAAQKQAINDLFGSLTKLGIVTTQTGGKWYIAPVRTMADLGSTVLSGLKGDDLFELMHLGS